MMKDVLRSFFTRDIMRKIIALVLALLLYWHIRGILSVERTVSGIPVEIQTEPSLIVSADKSHFANVKVKVPKERIADLRPGEFSCRVRVREEDFINGKCEIPLTPKNFTAPKWVTIDSVVADKGGTPSLSLTVFRKKTEDVTPVADFSGKLSDEYSYSTSFVPATVQVSGPESMVRDIEIKTKKIPLNESIRESFDYDVPLMPPDGVSVVPEKVRATVTVEPRYSTKIITHVPLEVLQENSAEKREISFEPERVNVVLKGPRSFLAMCNAENLRAFVDLTGIRKSGVHTLEPQCRVLTSGVTVFSITPAEIRVKIK